MANKDSAGDTDQTNQAAQPSLLLMLMISASANNTIPGWTETLPHYCRPAKRDAGNENAPENCIAKSERTQQKKKKGHNTRAETALAMRCL